MKRLIPKTLKIIILGSIICALSLVLLYQLNLKKESNNIKTAKREYLKNTSDLSKTKDNFNLDQKTHPLIHFNQIAFDQGLIEISKKNSPVNYKVSGGITPHDLSVSFILTDFYQRLSNQKPSTIIVIGPNHYESGDFKALTSLLSWETPFGKVSTNQKIIESLLNDNLIKIDDQVLENDHAVSGSMSFIKYFLPETKVVPILLKRSMTEDDCQRLAEKIKKLIDENTVVVSAVDFSHYLNAESARQKDIVTQNAIKSHDYRQILSMSNDYLDSPASVVTLLMLMKKLNVKNQDILFHSNSGDIQKNEFIQTTSYFSIFFY